jgi:hypothetical protein
MKSIRLFTLFLAGIFLLSFTSTNDALNKGRLKYMVVEGDTTAKFVYTADGKISEIESLHHYEKYNYDTAGRLSKYEHAADPKGYWAAKGSNKKERMTAKSSQITSYKVYEYDVQNRLVQEKYYMAYYKNQGLEFEFSSSTRFIYNKDNTVSRANTYNPKGDLYQYSTYAYDKRGNRIKENYYFQIPGDSELKLMSETTYKFDAKTNPNSTVKGLQTGDYTDNPNNIIEREILYKLPGGGNTVLTSAYTYNETGLPLTCTYSNNSSAFSYVYE